MSSPLELIREGILSGDWQKVCNGYQGISGQNLEPPATDVKVVWRPDQFLDDFNEVVTEFVRTYQSKSSEEPAPVKKPKAKPKPKVEAEPPKPAPIPVAAPTPKPTPRSAADITEQHRVQHGRPQQQQREDGKTACRVEPFQPGMTNTFVDDRSIAADDIEISNKLTAGKQPEARRPAVKKVDVTCCKCNRDYQVEPIHAPKGLGSDKGEKASYVCNSCVGRRNRN